MAKKQKSGLTRKQINFPDDWIRAIDRARGTMSFGDFVRQAVREKLATRKLSEMPAWGQGRPRKRTR